MPSPDLLEIRVDGWRSGIRFDAAHVLPHHPKCGRLHGHTYALHAVVRGRAGPRGFVLDFGDVKKALKVIADRLDHHVLVPTKSADYRVEETPAGVAFAIGGKRYVFPREDVELLPIERSTAEDLAQYVCRELLAAVDMPENVVAVEIGVDESYGKGAWFAHPLR